MTTVKYPGVDVKRRRTTRPQQLPDREALVLGALHFFAPRASYGVGIQEQIKTTHQITVGPGSLYVMLRRLVAKGLVKRVGPPKFWDDEVAFERERSRRRAGRRQFYRITPEGTAALRAKVALLTPLFRLLSPGSG